MANLTIKERLESAGFKLVLSYLDKDPDANIPKVLNWVDRFDREDNVKVQRDAFREVISDPNNNMYKLIKKVWTEIDGGVRRKFFENFMLNATAIGGGRQKKVREEHGCNSPWAILMDPTSACNLKCIGCWAAEYGNKLSMSFETLDNIIEQGKQLGTFMYIFSGGEPLVRKKDIIRLCEKHNDCMFLSFTNGTLIDEAFANEMLRVKNFVPAISIEGYEEATDSRRGAGTYKAVIRAMDILKEKKLPFGISVCYTRNNTDVIGSEEFWDDMIAKGALFAWFFTYMPVGKDAVPDLMVTPEQREFMYYKVREFRQTKPIFTIDFWNDGDYIDGCIAGGRYYLHINANGDIEPCAFIHYSDSSVYNKTLLEAYKSPLFMQYRAGQPFNKNLYRPCPLLDNPEALAGIVDRSGAKSTDAVSPEDVHVLCGKCTEAAKHWAPVADKLWVEKHPDKPLTKTEEPAEAVAACKGCTACGK
ncbi:radical SAM protein [Papillibacter cinnamivorans]|uniref:Radical SAM superfamily enzyme, MoaA/NifB/PqqE/SkfB family n=1 Tax=Papillibacter cinnamivorans DSM 12816 TaxID=1122930 RepID=A0A1W2CQT3_9FIRM|nr:radical SAM protein [Papillibacter cinnamivorans]SMC87617.1 Radical SAM superfamily enzyme, MoaA/NifB/PqqE/SkfB family [Papillibacter cinnamivorans DSM 12816]